MNKPIPTKVASAGVRSFIPAKAVPLVLLAVLLLGAAWWFFGRAETALSPAVPLAHDTALPKTTEDFSALPAAAGTGQTGTLPGAPLPPALPPLPRHPEAFAHAPDNPFRCSPMFYRVDGRFCDWQSDHRVARSPAEARWMIRQGYPRLDQREWAMHRSAAEVEAEARRTGLVSLWNLALEMRLAEATTAEEARIVARQMGRIAREGRSLYALEQQALAWLHVAQLEILETGPITVSALGAAPDSVEFPFANAADSAVELGVLGDPRAMERVFRAIEAAAPPSLEMLGRSSGPQVASLMSQTFNSMRRAQGRAAQGQGRRGYFFRFTLADIAPRPTPMEVSDPSGRPVWIGEP